MRTLDAIRCLAFAGLTAAGPWLADRLTHGGAPAPLAWALTLIALAGCFAWLVRGDLRRSGGDADDDGAWPGGAEQRGA